MFQDLLGQTLKPQQQQSLPSFILTALTVTLFQIPGVQRWLHTVHHATTQEKEHGKIYQQGGITCGLKLRSEPKSMGFLEKFKDAHDGTSSMKYLETWVWSVERTQVDYIDIYIYIDDSQSCLPLDGHNRYQVKTLHSRPCISFMFRTSLHRSVSSTEIVFYI